MRRSGGGGGGGGGGHHYGGDSSGGNTPHAYTAAAAPPPQQQQQHQHYQHQQQQHSKAEHNQWRWERDGSKLQSPMSPHMFNNEGQGNEASRSYYQAQRPEPRTATERQGSHDSRSQPRGEMNVGYEENLMPQSFEGLEQKFLDDIMILSKEQSDAEDAEIARHRERINVINAQYQEQLVALRAQHASRREEFLRRESHSRQQQFQQASMDHYPSSGPSDPQGYSAVAPPVREPHRPYNTDDYDSHRERARYLGSGRNSEYEPRVQYPGGRMYDTGSRYY